MKRSDLDPADPRQGADFRLMAVALATATGDMEWVRGPYATLFLEPVADGPDRLAAADPEAAAALQETARTSLAQEPSPAIPELDQANLLELAGLLTQGELAESGLAKLRVELGLEDDEIDAREFTDTQDLPAIVIIGAGMAGLIMGARLKRAGVPFRIIEKNTRVGGVWVENTYPECGVDTHPHLYAWSTAPNAYWSSDNVKRDEIIDYIQRFAVDNDLLGHVTFGLEMTTARWDADSSGWHLSARDLDSQQPVELQADILITAVGILNRPKLPEIPGLETFSGKIMHTAAWRDDVVIDGRRVGLLGNGSSGVQVGRHLGRHAASLTAFQRSPAWIRPRRPARPIAAHQELLAHLPFYERWHRVLLGWQFGDRLQPLLINDPAWEGPGANERSAAMREDLIEYIRDQVDGRADLMDKLVPDYPPYTKRMVSDNDWYQTLTLPNVELVTDPVVGATTRGLVTADGREIELDVIVCATGFHGTRFLWPMDIVGPSGLTPSAAAGGDEEIRAYLGTTLPGFPNLFSLAGPNSSAGYAGAASFVAECQSRYVMSCIRQMITRSIRTVEVREEVCRDYNERLDEELEKTVWSYGDVSSRYRTATGRVFTNHPWTLQEFWNMTRSCDLSAFEVHLDQATVSS